MRKSLTLLLGLMAVGCNSGSSVGVTAPAVAAPTPDPGFPAGSAFTIVSGESGAPIAGATLYVGGRGMPADSAGRVTLAERLDRNTPIDVTAPGYLDRITRLRSSDPISLWPRRSPTGLDEDFSARLVYTSAGGDGGPLAGTGLVRLGDSTRQVFVVPTAEIVGDSIGMDTLISAANRLTAAHGGRIAFTVSGSAPSTAVRFDAVRDRSPDTCSATVLAFVQRRYSGFTIIGGLANFCLVEALHSVATATHELGHLFGLQHSNDNFDLMYPFLNRVDDFSPREGLAMRLMLLRPPSNAYPDNDRHVTTSAARWSDTIVCPR